MFLVQVRTQLYIKIKITGNFSVDRLGDRLKLKIMNYCKQVENRNGSIDLSRSDLKIYIFSLLKIFILDC